MSDRERRPPGSGDGGDLVRPAISGKPGGKSTPKTTSQIQRSSTPVAVDYSKATYPDAASLAGSADETLHFDLTGRTASQPRDLGQVQMRGEAATASQTTGDAEPEQVREAAGAGLTGPPSSLPHLGAIQQSFGPDQDLSHVGAHIGGPAADACDAIGATAYATGNAVAFASNPDLHTAAHEAAHVVQQAQGVSLYGGVGEAGDIHEQQADAAADRVVAGQSAADLFGPAEVGAASASSANASVLPTAAAVQRQPRPDVEKAHETPAISWTMMQVVTLKNGKPFRTPWRGEAKLRGEVSGPESFKAIRGEDGTWTWEPRPSEPFRVDTSKDYKGGIDVEEWARDADTIYVVTWDRGGTGAGVGLGEQGAGNGDTAHGPIVLDDISLINNDEPAAAVGPPSRGGGVDDEGSLRKGVDGPVVDARDWASAASLARVRDSVAHPESEGRGRGEGAQPGDGDHQEGVDVASGGIGGDSSWTQSDSSELATEGGRIPEPGGLVGGESTGTGGKDDHGVTFANGLIGWFDMPTNLAVLATLGVLLADADLSGVGHEIVQKVVRGKLGRKAVRNLLNERIDDAVERKIRTFEEEVAPQLPAYQQASARAKKLKINETRDAARLAAVQDLHEQIDRDMASIAADLENLAHHADDEGHH